MKTKDDPFGTAIFLHIHAQSYVHCEKVFDDIMTPCEEILTSLGV